MFSENAPSKGIQSTKKGVKNRSGFGQPLAKTRPQGEVKLLKQKRNKKPRVG